MRHGGDPDEENTSGQLALFAEGEVPAANRHSPHRAVRHFPRSPVPVDESLAPVSVDSDVSLPPYLPNQEQLQSLDLDPSWAPVFTAIARRAGADVALYCAYVFLGWSDLDAYRIVRGGVQTFNLKRVPESFRQRSAPYMAQVVSRLMPHRLWMFQRVRQVVDNPEADWAVRGGLLRMITQHYMEAERVAAMRADVDRGQPAGNYADAAYSGGGLASLGNTINERILTGGAILVIPGRGETVEGEITVVEEDA